VLEVGIVFGGARLEPRSNSASAEVEPGGIEAPVTIPSSLGRNRIGIGVRFIGSVSEKRNY
jgi:hypothetical protein